MTATIASDLKFLYDKEGVPEEISEKLKSAGVLTLKQFAVLVDTPEELRTIGKSDLGIDGAQLSGKVQLSRLICAWNAARARAQEQDKTEAEAQVRNLAKPVPVCDYNTMRKQFKEKFWKLEDAKAPSRQYIEQQLEKVEKSDWRAERLTEVVADKEDNKDGMMPVFDVTGVFKSLKTKSTVPMPANSEELRSRLHIMAASWVMVAAQQTHNPTIRDVTPTVFSQYADYLLGERVWKLAARGPDGGEVSGPSWALLLAYEFEIRSHAANLMSEDGLSLVEALKKSMEDTTVRDLYFLTPLKMSLGTKRGGGGQTADAPGPPSKRRRGRNNGNNGPQTRAPPPPPSQGAR